MRVGIAIAARRKIADRRGIRVGIVECANGIGAIGWRWIGPMTAAEVSANLVFQSQFQVSPNPAKPGQRKSKKILGFPSPNQAFSMGYADPQGVFSFLGLLWRKIDMLMM
jgi:hypothetical protein